MRKYYKHLSILLILIVVSVSGCIGETITDENKDITLDVIKQRLESFETYSCDVYQKCYDGDACEKPFLDGRLVADKTINKIRTEMEEMQWDETKTKLIINRRRVSIFDGSNDELSTVAIFDDSLEDQYYSKTILKEGGINPLTNENVMEMAEKLIDMIIAEPDKNSVRTGTFVNEKTNETIDAILITVNGIDVGGLDAETYLPLCIEGLCLTNCQMGVEIDQSEFEFPESYKISTIRNYRESCTQDSDCEDDDEYSSDTCEENNICRHYYSYCSGELC